MGFPILVRWRLYIESGPWHPFYLCLCFAACSIICYWKCIMRLLVCHYSLHDSLIGAEWDFYICSKKGMAMQKMKTSEIRRPLISDVFIFLHGHSFFGLRILGFLKLSISVLPSLEYQIELIIMEPLCVKVIFSIRIYMGVLGFETDCPCGVWCCN